MPQFRTRVDLIVLDVSVLDRNRRPVRGLTATDFSLLEDGQPQPIQMFSAVDIPDPDPPPAPGPPAAAWLRDVASDVRSNEDDANAQIFLIVLDDANPMEADELVHARRYARSIIDRLGPRDLAAIAFLADARSGQEFTHDRRRLLAAIDRFNGPVPSGGWTMGALEMLGPTMALSSLKAQAEALTELPAARKAVIYISTRGAAVPDRLAQTGDAEGEEGEQGVDATGMQVQNIGQFGEMVRAAQRANLNIYCLDPGGLRAPKTARRPPLSGGEGPTTRYIHNPNVTGVASLLAISNNTGGFAIVHTNDPQPGITQVFRENRSYYLLAYASSNPRVAGRYRRIDVRVSRADVTVRTRSGYFEPDRHEMKKAAAAVPSSDAALAAPVARSDVPLQLTAAAFAIPGKRQAAVAVALAVRENAAEGSPRAANLNVIVSAYDYVARRRASEQLRARAVLKASPDGRAMFEVLTRLDLPPGRYQVRAAVAQSPEGYAGAPGPSAGATRGGSVFCDLDVPDFSGEPLSLSDLILTPAAGFRTAGGDRLKSLIPVMPTTLREFVSTDEVRAFVRVYQGGKGQLADVALRSQVVDQHSVTVFDAAETVPSHRFSPTRSADYSLTVPIAQLKPGPHLLTVEATVGARAVRKDVRWTISSDASGTTPTFRLTPPP